MNQTINNHMDECFNKLLNPEPKINTYIISISQNGSHREYKIKGETMNQAESNLQEFIGEYDNHGCRAL